MDKETEKKVNEIIKLTTELSCEIRDCLNNWIERHSNLKSEEVSQVICQVMAYKLGFIDEICVYLGMNEDARGKLLDHFIKRGSETAKEYLSKRESGENPGVFSNKDLLN